MKGVSSHEKTLFSRIGKAAMRKYIVKQRYSSEVFERNHLNVAADFTAAV